MRPHHHREHGDRDDRPDHRAVPPERAPRVVGDHLGDDADRREDQDIDLRVAQKPEEVLPQERTAAAGRSFERDATNHETTRQEEARAGIAIHQLEDRRRLQRRKREQEEQRRHQLRPDEKGEPAQGEARRAQLDDRRDDIHRVERCGQSQKVNAGQPQVLPACGEDGKRRVRRPAGVGGAARDEEADRHQQPGGEIDPVAGGVETREGHLGSADVERHQVIAEGAGQERDDGEEDHDRAVHGHELVVELGRHVGARRVGWSDGGGERGRQRRRRPRELPSHQQHQEEADDQEGDGGQRVLQSDGFVVSQRHRLAKLRLELHTL